ncbi:hypothetical protein [Granulibacter bethesdensis]|uniref:hypothetical protein n=1 Tax=Granulibacter bethesdensis TaxID=364410 RepID=UPI0002F35694|nr:hypothetical protein [Granulibacter bethesdensis]APG31105.1 Hypothetical protein GbCGDNIH4_0262 [Granulibacter bethesdensis CGDNIH4]
MSQLQAMADVVLHLLRQLIGFAMQVTGALVGWLENGMRALGLGAELRLLALVLIAGLLLAASLHLRRGVVRVLLVVAAALFALRVALVLLPVHH